MKINYVIRGEDHIPNTPKQILIQEALGFPTPYYAHLPLILGPDKSKLSKRHNAMSINEYKELGYLPEALINFMVFLGWNPKDEREFFLLDDLIKEFSLKNIRKSGAIFNIQKLDYLNGYYIRHTDLNKLTKMPNQVILFFYLQHQQVLIYLEMHMREETNLTKKYFICKTFSTPPPS